MLNGGESVARVWADLFARAGGHIATEAEITDDPDLHLLVDGRRHDPQSADGDVYSFCIEPSATHNLRLCSRRGVPSLVGVTAHDHRTLGVAIAQIVIESGGIPVRFDHDMPQLREGGCYPLEDGFSWTDGDFVRMDGEREGTVETVVEARRHAASLTSISVPPAPSAAKRNCGVA